MRRRFQHFMMISLLLLISLEGLSADLYRIDSNPYQERTSNNQGKKTSVNLAEGTLNPANENGKITIVDHIARSRIRTLKDNSQFTSFSTLESLGTYYGGGYKITLDADRLQADIETRKISGVKIHTTEDITAGIKKEMAETLRFSELSPETVLKFHADLDAHIKAYYAMVRIDKKPTPDCDKFFWSGIDSLKLKYTDIFTKVSKDDYVSYSYLANALRHVTTDHEVLVEGKVPGQYFTIDNLALLDMKKSEQALARLGQKPKFQAHCQQ